MNIFNDSKNNSNTLSVRFCKLWKTFENIDFKGENDKNSHWQQNFRKYGQTFSIFSKTMTYGIKIQKMSSRKPFCPGILRITAL